MAVPLLSWDKQNSRRRGVIVAAAFTLILLILTATSHYRAPRRHHLEQSIDYAPPAADPEKTVSVPHFTKPQDVVIVGYVFFGRKSRVEILRCYIEVR